MLNAFSSSIKITNHNSTTGHSTFSAFVPQKADSSNSAKRWLLPYADFLTVLFCITVVWCGLALKQAYWLQIQNQKLHQALTQASQQLTLANTQLVQQQAHINHLTQTVKTQKINQVTPPAVPSVGATTGGGVNPHPTNKTVR
jgi:hypothetical protein